MKPTEWHPTAISTLYVDADACPVKEEVYRVAERYGVPVFVVSNSWMRVPRVAWINPVVVGEGPDAADDWIADRAGRGDVVITADTPLADRALRLAPRPSTRRDANSPQTASEAPWPPE